MDLNTLKKTNATRWSNCHISADKGPQFKTAADSLTLNKARYQAVATMLVKQGYNIPWYFIAVTHYRESNANFNTYLGNGQPLNKKTTLVPKGRGPFTTWEDGAVDALVYAPPYAAKNTDWSIGGTLTMLEEYNGLGYANMDRPSPYVWAGTDQYTSGKYVSDGVFSPATVDTQLGCAGLLKFLGVFKTAPTGAGTAAVVVGGAGTAAVAHTHQTWWMWMEAHWIALLVGAIGVGLFIDLALAIYNNEKNQLKVSNVQTSPVVG